MNGNRRNFLKKLAAIAAAAFGGTAVASQSQSPIITMRYEYTSKPSEDERRNITDYFRYIDKLFEPQIWSIADDGHLVRHMQRRSDGRATELHCYCVK